MILAPVATADAEEVARAVVGIDAGARPIVFVHLGVGDAPAALSEGPREIPCYAFPERAVRALGRIAGHSSWKRRPVGTTPQLDGVDTVAAQCDRQGIPGRQPGRWMVVAGRCGGDAPSLRYRDRRRGRGLVAPKRPLLPPSNWDVPSL